MKRAFVAGLSIRWLLLFALAACSNDTSSNDGSRILDENPRNVADSGLDASRDAADPTRDSAAPTPDASPRDVSEPASEAAAPVDASVEEDASTQTLRARLCGDRTDWPAPLPVAGMRTATRVGNERFGFLEGPVWVDALGVLFFSDMNMSGGGTKGPPSQIRRLTPPASFDVFVADSGSNGLALFDDETLLAANHDTRGLSLFSARTGERRTFDITFEGNKLNSPNDLTVREDGRVFFSDPDYQLGSRERELNTTGVYSIPISKTAGTLAATLVDDKLTRPNGVALSPDQKTLYVGSSDDQIFKYTVAADGTVANKALFARPGGSDGMTVDCAGNLYVTTGTVQVFAPNGDKLGDITVAESPANVAFGGSDHRTLYITARTSLYAIALAVPGYPY